MSFFVSGYDAICIRLNVEFICVPKIIACPFLQVVLPSGKDVAEINPEFGEILKCPGRGVIVSGVAPPESGFDFYSRFFCPKLGINEVILLAFCLIHQNALQTSNSKYLPLQ